MTKKTKEKENAVDTTVLTEDGPLHPQYGTTNVELDPDKTDIHFTASYSTDIIALVTPFAILRSPRTWPQKLRGSRLACPSLFPNATSGGVLEQQDPMDENGGMLRGGKTLAPWKKHYRALKMSHQTTRLV